MCFSGALICFQTKDEGGGGGEIVGGSWFYMKIQSEGRFHRGGVWTSA